MPNVQWIHICLYLPQKKITTNVLELQCPSQNNALNVLCSRNCFKDCMTFRRWAVFDNTKSRVGLWQLYPPLVLMYSLWTRFYKTLLPLWILSCLLHYAGLKSIQSHDLKEPQLLEFFVAKYLDIVDTKVTNTDTVCLPKAPAFISEVWIYFLNNYDGPSLKLRVDIDLHIIILTLLASL